jgi:hypothetical protein
VNLNRLKNAALIMALFGLPHAISAEIAESFGLGARAVGFSGAGVASVNDWTSAFYNMAGVASPMNERAIFGNQEKSSEASGKIRLLRDDGSVSNNASSQDAIDKKLEAELLNQADKPTHQMGMNYLLQAAMPKISPVSTNSTVSENVSLATKGMVYGAVQLGLVFDTRSIINTPKNMPIRFGLALSLRDNGTIATVNDTTNESYNFMRLGREAQRILIISGVGAQVWKDRLSVGMGFNMFTGGKGRFSMTNVQIDPTGAAQVPNAEVQMDLTPAGAPVAGIQYRQNIKNRILMVGFNWRGETYMEMNPLDAEATTQLLQVALPLKLAILDFYSPHTFTLGVTYLHDEALKLSLDGEFQMWSRFKINSSRAEYLSKVNQSFDPFKNIFLVKFGAETRPGRYIAKLREVPLFVRLGFTFIPAFTPDQNGYSNFLDNNKIAYSLGASYFLNSNKIVKAPVEIIFGFQHQIWLPRTSTKAGDVLTKTLVNDPANQPDYTYTAQVIVVSLGVLMKF